MKKYWVLREELYRSFHQWPTLLAFLVIGCLVGWGASYIWPSYYKAITQIYVGFNPYRAFDDAKFLALAKPKYSNIDDYKNWQMSQLDAAIYTQGVIKDTLTQLQQGDPYWEDKNEDDLISMLLAEWRSAGTWSLTAKNSDPQRATQAAEAWSQVIIKRVKASILSARNIYRIDQKLQAINAEKLASTYRQEELTTVRGQLVMWVEEALSFPQNEPLAPNERWYILSLATRLAKYTPGWVAVLQGQPGPDSPPTAYLSWIDQITLYIDSELTDLETHLTSLNQEYSAQAEQYSQESDDSLGISPNLEVENIEQTTVKPIRPIGILSVIGGLIGLLIWVLTQLVMITHRK
jgi:hypothetical protein